MFDKNIKRFWDFAGDVANLFTGINYNLYQPPPGFSWDIGSGDDPIMVSEFDVVLLACKVMVEIFLDSLSSYNLDTHILLVF